MCLMDRRRKKGQNVKTEERERILKGVKPRKKRRENIMPLEQNILESEQYDRKIREIEIRSKNLRLRREREIRLQMARGDKPTVIPGGFIY